MTRWRNVCRHVQSLLRRFRLYPKPVVSKNSMIYHLFKVDSSGMRRWHDQTGPFSSITLSFRNRTLGPGAVTTPSPHIDLRSGHNRGQSNYVDTYLGIPTADDVNMHKVLPKMMMWLMQYLMQYLKSLIPIGSVFIEMEVVLNVGDCVEVYWSREWRHLPGTMRGKSLI